MTGASAPPSGSRPSDGAQEVSTLTGFDPSRGQTREQAFSGCDYVHDEAWEYCHPLNQLGDLLDDHFWIDGHDAVVRVGRLAIMTDKFAIRVHTDDGGWEFRFFDSEIAAERAHEAIAIEAQRAGTAKTGPVHESAGPQDIAQPEPSS